MEKKENINDFANYLEQIITLSEEMKKREVGAYKAASKPRGRDWADKASFIGGLGAIGIGALTGNKEIVKGGADWMDTFTPTRDALYKNKQDRILRNTLGGLDAERNALNTGMKARSMMYDANADADMVAYNKGKDLEAQKIRMYEMMNNLERTKQAQNQPENISTDELLARMVQNGDITPKQFINYKMKGGGSKAPGETMTPGQKVSYLEKLRNAQVNDIFNRATTIAGGLDPKYEITNPINSRESLSQASNSTANYKTNPWFGQGVLQPDSSLYNLNNELAGIDSTYLSQLQSLGNVPPEVDAWGRAKYRDWDKADYNLKMKKYRLHNQ